jgi:hypothetical protein|tara:strand:+ start:3164 stop:3562 length:399 start_codon:yes stop_codon:yes gene_type:complete
MATVTPKLTITSTDLLSQNLNLSLSTSITASSTTGLARNAITSTAKGTASGQVTLHTAADFTAPAYLYVKNTDSTASDHIIVYDATTSGNPILLLLQGGEFAFMPLNSSIDLKAYAVTSGTVVEFMVFGTEA